MKQRLLTTLTISRHKYHQHLPIRLRPRLGAAEMGTRSLQPLLRSICGFLVKEAGEGREEEGPSEGGFGRGAGNGGGCQGETGGSVKVIL
jgi:hypothetical protein